MMKLRKNQKGNAAILFAVMIPILFGIFTLGSDGVRAIQTKARLEDAAEAAVFAISAHNDPNQHNTGRASLVNELIARNYIEFYIRDVDSIEEIKVYKRDCENISECKSGLTRGEQRYFENKISVTTKQKSWFSGNSTIIGLGDSFRTTGGSTARKYQSEAVDVMFAADFSGSMYDSWSNGTVKYIDLISIIKSTTAELKKFNDLANSVGVNTVGIVPYNDISYRKSRLKNQDVELCQLNRGTTDTDQIISELWIEKLDNCSINPSSVRFHEIPLTTDFENFNKAVASFRAGGPTSSYQAIIPAAHALRRGINSRRLLIIISDGMDIKPNLTFTGELVSKGMCNKIRQGLSSDRTPSNDPIREKIALIGFDYDPNILNPALRDCVGSDNVYKAESPSEVLNAILELISEEVGRLKS